MVRLFTADRSRSIAAGQLIEHLPGATALAPANATLRAAFPKGLSAHSVRYFAAPVMDGDYRNWLIEAVAEQVRLESAPEAPSRFVSSQGRAIRWIEEALEPCRDQLSAPDLRRLVLAIRSAIGIEALVWLVDVAGLTRDDAGDLMRWSASSLLQSALRDRDAKSH